ncbi:MAG TPA: efflux RND transporter periplasmic adaptor subunit [Wenzhouxiangella sp.]|nr:efflux RND transporter periplasmic adaptor subunit [Wenzhouxiangella sp.]
MNEIKDPELQEMADKVRTAMASQRRRGRSGLVGWAAAGLVIVVLLIWWLWPSAEGIEWETHAIDRGDMVLVVTASGNLEPRSEVTVGAEVSGLISEVLVTENDRVSYGDVLARFDTEELEVNLAQAEARLELARASVAEAEATLEESTIEQRRTVSMHERNMASQAEVDTARAAVMRARARVMSANASVSEAEAALSASRTRLEKAIITSPVNGVVLKRDIEPGSTVAASFQAPELFILAEDLREMELHISLDEADVSQVKSGQPATFTVDAWPGREFEAVVQRVFLYPDTESNVVTYTTVLDVDNPDEELLPGMTATATITTGTHENILRVPSMAFRFQPPGDEPAGGGGRGMFMMGPMRSRSSARDDNAVWVLRDDAGEEKPEPVQVHVRTGRTDGRFTEITSDELKEGDKVVVGFSGGKG